MYKLLIVDDEDIEREGMEKFIPWSNYGVEQVETAWNGVEAFEKIQTYKPDIVLTDIKMPVMDGIELIKKTRKSFPDIEFIVLSGYGEYEFTSQVMEEGVRHYILKPCDEEKIVKVLNKVKCAIKDKRQQKEKDAQYSYTVRRLLPRAKEQIFRNMLLNREQFKEDYQLFMDELGENSPKVQVLAMRFENKMGNLEQFVLENILGELLGESNILLSTAIQKEFLFLVSIDNIQDIKNTVGRTKVEFKRITSCPIYAAISDKGELSEVHELYLQIKELFQIGGKEYQDSLLHYNLFQEIKSQSASLIDYQKLRESKDYGEILFEVYLTFVKMELENYSLKKKEEIFSWILKVLYGEQLDFNNDRNNQDKEQEGWELLEKVVDLIAERQGVALKEGREAQRVRRMLLATYQYLGNPELNIRFLAKEVLYINEEYFGRVFLKNRRVKFSTFLLVQRISIAQRILEYKPDIKISLLAKLVGYSSDGQYFSKVFKKITEMSPTEYREKLNK